MSPSALFLLALAFCPTPRTDEVDHSDFDAILRATVRNERVDYLILRRDHYPALVAYLDRLAKVDATKLPRPAHLATLLNLYNATMLRAVVERFRDGFSVGDDEFGIFDEPLVRFGGESFSLNALENEKIRPVFKEPRIHVALVCAARSCPPLLARAYQAKGLRDTLEDNMFRFVRDPSRNPIDAKNEKLGISRIFEWYADDFGGTEGIASYVNRYHKDDLADLSPTFTEYSWELNLAAPKGGEWVVLPQAASLVDEPGDEKGQVAREKAVFEVIGRKDGWLKVDRGLGLGSAWVEQAKTASWKAPPRR